MKNLERAKQAHLEALKAIAQYDTQGATQLTIPFIEMFFGISQIQFARQHPNR
jgi:hypothetical protein